MATTSVATNSSFIVNLVELQNVVTSASGETPLSQLQQMVDYTTKSINVNTINAFDTTPIQVTAPINFTEATVGGSAVSGGGSLTSGATSVQLTDTSQPAATAFQLSTSAGAALTVAVNGDATFAGVVSADAFVTTSDGRRKQDVRQLRDALAAIQAIRGVSYTLNGTRRHAGVIAQEVAEVAPETVYEADGTFQVEYSGLVAYLIEAVTELAARVEALEKNVAR